MTFSAVLEEMKKGRCATRKCCNDKDQFVTVGDILSVDDCTTTFALGYGDVRNHALIFHGNRGNQLWIPTHSDLLANDWELI